MELLLHVAGMWALASVLVAVSLGALIRQRDLEPPASRVPASPAQFDLTR